MLARFVRGTAALTPDTLCVMCVSTLSPESAYSTKNNIVFPGTAAQATEAEKLAAARAADPASIGQDTTAVATNAVTLTKHIKR